MVFCLCDFSTTPPSHFSSPICARRSAKSENPGCSKGYMHPLWKSATLRQLYLKAVNKSIAFHDGKKITGIRLSPDTRYFVANPA